VRSPHTIELNHHVTSFTFFDLTLFYLSVMIVCCNLLSGGQGTDIGRSMLFLLHAFQYLEVKSSCSFIAN